jgi:hypothetical protein
LAERSLFQNNDAVIAKGSYAEGFYVYYWYVVVSAVRSVLTFMATAISLNIASSVILPFSFDLKRFPKKS